MTQILELVFTAFAGPRQSRTVWPSGGSAFDLMVWDHIRVVRADPRNCRDARAQNSKMIIQASAKFSDRPNCTVSLPGLGARSNREDRLLER